MAITGLAMYALWGDGGKGNERQEYPSSYEADLLYYEQEILDR
jgi:hypothetical protein